MMLKKMIGKKISLFFIGLLFPSSMIASFIDNEETVEEDFTTDENNSDLQELSREEKVFLEVLIGFAVIKTAYYCFSKNKKSTQAPLNVPPEQNPHTPLPQKTLTNQPKNEGCVEKFKNSELLKEKSS